MNNEYPLEWLDSLVLQHFNPDKTEVGKFTEEDLTVISKNIKSESSRIEIRIKNEIFAMKRKRQIKLRVRKYHSTLIFLMDNMVDNCKTGPFQLPALLAIGESIIKCLDELLSFVENRYAGYLSLDEKVPLSYLLVSRKEMHLKLKKIQLQAKLNFSVDLGVLKLAAEELTAAASLHSRTRMTFRQVLYQRRVLRELEEMDCTDCGSELFSALDRVLVSINFNSRNYIGILISRFTEMLASAPAAKEKVGMLSRCFKEFRQLDTNRGMFLNADVQHIATVLENWIQNELAYQEKLMELSVSEPTASSADGGTEHKLECDLSADQIGIILRAADEARVVKSRSMSLVFQRIVPHLSTAFKRDLSYQSVRSKSYNAEDNDKNIAIMTLEKMIKKIRSY